MTMLDVRTYHSHTETSQMSFGIATIAEDNIIPFFAIILIRAAHANCTVQCGFQNENPLALSSKGK